MSNRLAGKVAIVTGSSSGIGRATCFHYAAEGALLVCGDLNPGSRYDSNDEETRGNTHERITQTGGRAIFVQVDVRKPEQVEQLVEAAVQTFGRLDIMVNNAGIGIDEPRPLWELEPESWDRMLDVNLKGVFLGIKFACKQMLKQDPLPGGDRGWIINAASILGLGGQSAAGEVYCPEDVVGIRRWNEAALTSSFI